MIHRLRLRALPFAALAATVLAGCATNAPQDIFQPEGDNARKIDEIQRFPFWAAGAVGVAVTVLTIFVVWRYKDRGQPIPHQGHGKAIVEIGSIAFSGILLFVVGIFSVQGIWQQAKTSDCAMTVNVTGQQWWWEYSYPQQAGIETPIVTSGQLVIPAGECVMLRLTSRDVIHSFWIPKLNGKKDAVPGRVHLLRMQADQPGFYTGQCTEFCGLSHANMKMDLISLSKTDFATWVGMQNQLTKNLLTDEDAAGRGESVFKQQCARCHQVNGLTDGEDKPIISQADGLLVSGAAPNLTHLMSRTTFAGATYSLLNDACRDDLMSTPSTEFGAKYLGGVADGCLNIIELKEWLRNAPDKKPMYPETNDDGKGRGMPSFSEVLSDKQIDDLVEYLKTLK